MYYGGCITSNLSFVLKKDFEQKQEINGEKSAPA